jgi:hypothetical protein
MAYALASTSAKAKGFAPVHCLRILWGIMLAFLWGLERVKLPD